MVYSTISKQVTIDYVNKNKTIMNHIRIEPWNTI